MTRLNMFPQIKAMQKKTEAMIKDEVDHKSHMELRDIQTIGQMGNFAIRRIGQEVENTG